MEIKTYDHTDLQPVPKEYGDERFRFQFIADVSGDNPDIFNGDNEVVTEKLKSIDAIGKEDFIDEEPACFFIYFKTEEAGVAFLKKLSAYIRHKRALIEKARDF